MWWKRQGMPLLKSDGRAGAQAEEPGDDVDQAPGFPGVDQRAEGETAGGEAPGIENAGAFIGEGDLDEGETLVVLEPDIEGGLVGVHQVALQQQGVGLGIGDDGLQGVRALQQALDQRDCPSSGNTGRRAFSD